MLALSVVLANRRGREPGALTKIGKVAEDLLEWGLSLGDFTFGLPLPPAPVVGVEFVGRADDVAPGRRAVGRHATTQIRQRRRHQVSSTSHQTVLRGEPDETGTLWIPLEDINQVRGKQFSTRDMRRRSLLPGEDFQIVHPRDELAKKFWQPHTVQSPQILVSEPGMRRLMMQAAGPADRDLQDWVTAQSLPALGTPRRVGRPRAAPSSILHRRGAHHR